MKCPECGSKMNENVEKNFHYTMSGLSRVYLDGVIVQECQNKDCGEEIVTIPNQVELHNLLANMIAKQEHRLVGEEIRFLRTHLGLSGQDFSRLIGVDHATVSRWENGKSAMSSVAERLLRIMILANKEPVSDYTLMDKMAQKESKTSKKRMLRVKNSHWSAQETA